MAKKKLKKFKAKGPKKAKKALKKVAKKALKPGVQAMPAGRQAVLPKSAVDTEKLLKQLMEKAAERNFVTEAEILHALPHFEDDISSLEKIMDALDKRGIEVVDQEVASVWEQNKPKTPSEEKPTKGRK